MIVRNEAAVIGRCLESVKGIMSHWVICDTGSADDTPQIIREVLKGIPGTLHRVPWVNFGFNRTQALQLARGKADYRLMIDADNIVHVHGEFLHKLIADAYLLRFEGDNDHHLPLLLSDREDWHYKGVTHETVPFDSAHPWVKLADLSITHHQDGGMRAGKYERDVQLLTRGIEDEPDNSRYYFYLAQSYRDLGRCEDALTWYQRRIPMGGWDEELWYARYQVARMMHRLGRDWPVVQNHYLAAYESRPWRLEPLVHIARYYREMNQFALGYLFSRAIVGAPYPEDILFLERNVYEYELPMEYAICCYWLGKHEEAIRVNDIITTNRRIPPAVAEAAASNRRRSEEALLANAERGTRSAEHPE
jgi:glycosyltransferase involved in cell wall biosynthesis